MAERHSELISEKSNVIPNLIRNPLIMRGMLKQVQHDAGWGMLNQVQHDVGWGMLKQVQHDA